MERALAALRAAVSAPDPVIAGQVRLLHANLPVSQAVVLVNGALLAAIQSAVVDVRVAATWFACLALVAAVRMTLGLRFDRDPSAPRNSLRWRSAFLAGAAAAGLVWGAAAWVIFPPASIVHQVFLAFVVSGMIAGSTAVLAPSFRVFAVFAVAAAVPVVARFIAAGTDIHYVMAAMSTIFLLAMLSVGRRIHDAITITLRLRAENQNLIDGLSSEKARMETVNARLLAAQDELRQSNEELEARVADRTAALQEADRRKDAFLAMLSHELRNPLAPIHNSLQLLERVDLRGADAHQAIEIIRRQARQVTRLVEDLLDTTRIASGKIELRLEPTDVRELVSCTVDDHRSMFRALDIALETRLPAEPVRAVLDPVRMAQVLGNLLQNAAKFTPAGGWTRVSLRAGEGAAEIEVSDSGVGIAPELMSSMFLPFVQGEQASARVSGGIGLGLAMVKGIAEMHGGTVQVRSQGSQKGATFVVRVPCRSGATTESMFSGCSSSGSSA